MKTSNVVINKMQLKLPSLSTNEGMARAAVAAFVAQLDPTAVELADIKCAISEAVTNAIVHGYRNSQGYININVWLIEGGTAKIEIRDRGCGIENVKLARQPLYTTDRESERSGMGFTVMESFMDKVKVTSKVGRGTSVTLYKTLSKRGIT
jgi:stage II sporulation protein AB (anti-sigma F factor)